MSNRLFKGVWIPAHIYLDNELSWSQKILLVEIDSFSKNNRECFVSNEHLSEHLQVSISSVEKSLRKLVALGYVIRTRKQIHGTSRRILRLDTSINYGSQPEESADDNRKKVRHTNTGTNSMTNSMKADRPQNIEVCENYFAELGYSDQARPFMDWYDQTDWTLKGGNQIKDWKATARTWARRQKEHAANKKGFQKQNFNAESIKSFVTEG
jgi:DNA-binding transcriptional MocR family regulator